MSSSKTRGQRKKTIKGGDPRNYVASEREIRKGVEERK